MSEQTYPIYSEEIKEELDKYYYIVYKIKCETRNRCYVSGMELWKKPIFSSGHLVRANVIIDDSGYFTEFPGVVVKDFEKDFKENYKLEGDVFDNRIYVTAIDCYSSNLHIRPFENGYAYVKWTIQSGCGVRSSRDCLRKITVYSLMNQQGKFLLPFAEQELKQYFYDMPIRDGLKSREYGSKNMPFIVDGVEYKNIKELEQNPYVIAYSELFPCFDSHDCAYETRRYRRYVVCQDERDKKRVSEILKVNQIKLAEFDPFEVKLHNYKYSKELSRLYIVSTDDASEGLRVISPEQDRARLKEHCKKEGE